MLRFFLAFCDVMIDLNQDVPFHLQPPVFRRFDHPTVYNYNPEPQTSRGCKANQGDDLDEERCEECLHDEIVVSHLLVYYYYNFMLCQKCR